MKRTLFYKVFGGYLLIIVLLALLVMIFTSALIREHYIDTLSTDLENYNFALLPGITDLTDQRSCRRLDSLIKNIGAKSGTRITVIDTNGFVLADSEDDPATMDNHNNRQEIREAMIGQTGISIRFSRTIRKNMLYVAVPIKKDEALIGILRSSLCLDAVNALLGRLSIRILQALLIIVLIGGLIALFHASKLERPIKELVSMSRRIGQGDFDVNLFFKKNDEFKELADSFNIMVGQIKSLIIELSNEKEALDTIISSIQEGIMVIDKKGKIVMCNQSFERIVASAAVTDKFYWELIRQQEISKLVQNALAEKNTPLQTEIEITGRTYICSASPLSRANQIIITFHDITELVNAATMKKEFILNISHELRTPLTAIKGFVETLEDEKGNRKEQYIGIIKRHTDRLINIINDLQTLSRLEERMDLKIEEVDIRKMTKNIARMFESALRRKSLSLRLDFAPELPLLKADPFKLEQAIINLIDNAVKYTEQGEIVLSIEQKNHDFIIKVVDTGIGISEEHIPRIFERFYVVDQSRSRKLGGTGLGLSIVKHIIQAHGGNISVQSIVNQGTTFIITLPRQAK